MGYVVSAIIVIVAVALVWLWDRIMQRRIYGPPSERRPNDSTKRFLFLFGVKPPGAPKPPGPMTM
jgi:hypothetical protein